MDGFNRRRAGSLMSSVEYGRLHGKNTDLLFPEHQCAEVDEIFTYPWPIDEKCKGSSSSLSSTSTDDSVEVSHSPLEMKHFEDAINQGVFSDAFHHKKRERRKSFNKVSKRPSIEKCDIEQYGLIKSKSNEEIPKFMQRQRSYSEGIKSKESTRRRKGSQLECSEKIRQKLCNSGIDLIDVSSMDLSLDEIHDLQQRFYTCVSITNETNTAKENKNSMFVARTRSSSFF